MAEIPGAYVEALQFFTDVCDARDVSARLFFYEGTDANPPLIQAQMRVDCEGGDLIWIAQQAESRGYRVQAVDEGLMLEIA